MVSMKELNTSLEKMILSASGWRGIFASCGDEENTKPEITESQKIICGAAAFIFCEYLDNRLQAIMERGASPVILLGTDTRPTGRAVADAVISVSLACGCRVRYAGVVSAPEIMAWARSLSASEKNCGFIYISASHNPIGHNGLKFGLTDGGVLAANETEKLIAAFRSFTEKDDCIEKIQYLASAAGAEQLKQVYSSAAEAKAECFEAYYNFCGHVVWDGNKEIEAAFKNGIEKKPLGVVCDFNGSARTESIDRNYFSSLGIRFDFINGESGQIVHRIVPEGESLVPCARLLENAHARDASFLLGYVPDCDGDRGNLVIWDDSAGKARALEAQEVFALACVAELSHLLRARGGKSLPKTAIAVNDPTSARIDKIAGFFGVSVFRAEVGEANVVGLARRLREEGYTVRILGEGSAGGNITHPSAVRDPLNTVLAIAKLYTVRNSGNKPGLFELWCGVSAQTSLCRGDFSLADIITSLPQYVSTPAYSQDAVLRIKTNDHSILKDRYQQIFLREWETRKDDLKTRFGISNWEAIAYNGMLEKRGIIRFGEAGKGGLKINFLNSAGEAIAYIWMRGSATEPVFRIMADAQGDQTCVERELLQWQRCMIMEADAK
ncbi:MAG: phosphatidylglycerol lysyltransferase [Treponema sp.]|nr:phosphatidylglycerol lysyltransferase [Treponema sp.]